MTERPVVMITTHADFGVYAYDVRGPQPSMILGHDVQQGESVEQAVADVVAQVGVRVTEIMQAATS
jgi:hypothetical protein